MTLRMHACHRCGGAAYLESAEDNEWRCLQCARSVPPPAAEQETRKANDRAA